MSDNQIIKQELNVYLSDLHVLYVKLHNYHWNVVGTSFYVLHEKLEELYNAVATSIDEIAERIIMLKGVPFASMKDYLANATLQEACSSEVDGKKIMQSLLSDFEALLKQVVVIRKHADENNEPITVSNMEAAIEQYEKNIWMLSAYLK